MAWTTFPTLTDGQVLTGAHMQIVKSNFDETGPAKATTAGRILVTAGTNLIVERVVASQDITTAETTTSTSFVDLATPGPSVTVTTSTRALVSFQAQMANNTGSSPAQVGIDISGATTIAASSGIDLYANTTSQFRIGVMHLYTTLNAGSNTFKMQYRVNTSGTGTFLDRTLIVIGL